MNYFEILILTVSFLAIIISLFAIWLAMMFYRLYSQLCLLVTEMSKGLEMSTIRLERLPEILYNQNIVLSASSTPENQNGMEKKEPNDKQYPKVKNNPQQQNNKNKSKIKDKNLYSQILPESE